MIPWRVSWGSDPQGLAAAMSRLDAVYDSASDTPSNIAKEKLSDLAEAHGWTVPDLCRIVARRETDRQDSAIQPFVEALKDALTDWRSG